ncbi:OsmC family peroxiredoxin [Streptomyces sp. SID8382]|uniref:OsmC family protein n=1 Tax=Streptomyces malaysiensis TaxID=92644 RepID=UPI000C2C5D4D|nr:MULTISPECIES: OsmC family protein [unclassified Streptomyces]AUA16827.1 OsmC-like protein [Streptomyces sp. M56]MYX58040.1 OsmC family peroxiredoxin [Streptomyces sp. SID8382]
MTQTSNILNGVDRDALNATLDAVRQRPEIAQVTFTLGTGWEGGCRQVATTGEVRQAGAPVEARTARYTLESDEPAILLGSDTAASPGEYVVQALAGCYAVTYAANAAARGVELSSLRLDMEVDFDLRGFLGLDKSVRPGAQEIRVTVHAESPNTSRDGLEELTEAVQQRSPIRDTLANAVRVSTVLAQP